jgi:8-oxo-dGTP diphosphatase
VRAALDTHAFLICVVFLQRASVMNVRLRERAAVVCVHAGRLLCVQLRDPTSRIARLFVPGGGIEQGESAIQAAVRETLEETGYHVRALPESARVARYPYTWDCVTFAVTTHFFAAELIDPARPAEHVSDASYNEGTVWLALADVASAMRFEETMLEAITALLPRSGTGTSS